MYKLMLAEIQQEQNQIGVDQTTEQELLLHQQLLQEHLELQQMDGLAEHRIHLAGLLQALEQ